MIHTDENFCSSQTLGEEHEKSNQNLQSIRKFTDTLNLSQKQMLDLNNISNIFFYLKVRTRNKSYTFSRGASSNNFEIQRNVSGAFMKSKLMKASTNLHMSRSKSLPASIAVKSSMKRTLRLDPLPGSRNSTRQSACKPTSPSVLEGTPYDLEVVEHGAIDPTNYTTLSAQGVTLFKDKESYFTPLAQWEREFELFQKISLLKFFRQYSRWKCFIVWRSALRQRKMYEAGKQLQATLLHLRPALGRCLREVKDQVLAPLERVNVFDYCPGLKSSPRPSKSAAESAANKVDEPSSDITTIADTEETIQCTWDLTTFEQRQTAVSNQVRIAVREARNRAVTAVKEACETVLDEFMCGCLSWSQGLSGHVAAGKRRLQVNDPALTSVHVHKFVGDRRMTFVERAALRAQCMRLARFARLVDLQLSDRLRILCIEGVEELARALGTNCEDTDTDSQFLPTNSSLFRVAAVIETATNSLPNEANTNTHSLKITPTVSDFSKSIDMALDQCFAACLFELVSQDPELLPFLQTDLDTVLSGTSGSSVQSDIAGHDSGDHMTRLLNIINDDPKIVTVKSNIRATVAKDNASVDKCVASLEPWVELHRRSCDDIAAAQACVQQVEWEIADPNTNLHSDPAAYSASIDEYKAKLQSVHALPAFERVKVAATLSEHGSASESRRRDIEYYSGEDFNELPPTVSPICAFVVDIRQLRETCTAGINEYLNAVRELLPRQARRELQALLDKVGATCAVLSTEPSSVAAFARKQAVLSTTQRDIDQVRTQQARARGLVLLMDEQNWIVPDDLKALLRLLHEQMETLETVISLAQSVAGDEAAMFKDQVTEESPRLMDRLKDIRSKLTADALSACATRATCAGYNKTPEDEILVSEALTYLYEVDKEFQKVMQLVTQLVENRRLLDLTVEKRLYAEAETMDSLLRVHICLWKDLEAWGILITNLLETSVGEIDLEQLDTELGRLADTAKAASHVANQTTIIRCGWTESPYGSDYQNNINGTSSNSTSAENLLTDAPAGTDNECGAPTENPIVDVADKVATEDVQTGHTIEAPAKNPVISDTDEADTGTLGKVASELLRSVQDLAGRLRVVSELRNRSVKTRHMTAIANLMAPFTQNSAKSKEIGEDGNDSISTDSRDTNTSVLMLTFEELIRLCELQITQPFGSSNEVKLMDAILAVCESSREESALEEVLVEVAAIWNRKTLDVMIYNGRPHLFVLVNESEIIEELNVSSERVSAVLSSPYASVDSIRLAAESLQCWLSHLRETLMEWLRCQRSWMQLESVLGVGLGPGSTLDNLKTQAAQLLPKHAKLFQAVDKSFRWIMKQTREDPAVTKVIGQLPMDLGSPELISGPVAGPGRLETFRSHNTTLDQILLELQGHVDDNSF